MSSLLVWDGEGSPPASGCTVVLWRAFGSEAAPAAVSVPRLVEDDADALRRRYLAWIHDLGETCLDGRRLIDALEIRPEFSYWWMTLFAEKCNYSKSPCIDDALRLMAFADWAKGQAVASLVLVTANPALAECVRSWCARFSISFEWRRAEIAVGRLPLRERLYRILPSRLQAIAWLVLYALSRWPLRGVGVDGWCRADGRTSFFSYLFNLAPSALAAGRFESAYWGPLPAELQRDGCRTNWLHLYMRDRLLPTAARAADALRRFNMEPGGLGRHVALDGFLSARVVWRAMRDWARLRRRVRAFESAMPGRGGDMDIWPLFRQDWDESFSGRTSLANLLYFGLLESAVGMLPRRHVGVYLAENQPWEFALIYHWKAAGHGRLIAVPHSTVRFWDLRYFFDPRSYVRNGRNDLPLPDAVALNGPAALDAYRTGGYPADRLVEVEAVRYLHLADGIEARPVASGVALRILVLGEYRQRHTRQQMQLLEQAAALLPTNAIITVKPHPACPVHPEDYPRLRLAVVADPIAGLLGNCDVAYTSNVTSAAVDAYCAGIPVVCVTDPEGLNLSPLRGREGVTFAATPEELAAALSAAALGPRPGAGRRQGYFTLDPKLPRWRRMLAD